MEVIVFYAIIVGLSVFLAKKKNRNMILWGLLSLILSLFALIILVLLPKVQADDDKEKLESEPVKDKLESEPAKPVTSMKMFSLYAVCFVIIFAVLGNITYEKKIKVDGILQDPVYVTANIGEIEQKEKFKKGVSIKSYKINYAYKDSGKEYSNSFTLSADSFINYKNKKIIDVVYLKTNPALSMLKSASGARMGTTEWLTIIGKLLLFCLIISLLPFGVFAYKLGWIKAK